MKSLPELRRVLFLLAPEIVGTPVARNLLDVISDGQFFRGSSIPGNSVGMVVQGFQVSAVVVIGQAEDGNSRPDGQEYQHREERDEQGRINVLEVDPLWIACRVVVVIRLIANANADTHQTKSQHRPGRDDGSAQSTHDGILAEKDSDG